MIRKPPSSPQPTRATPSTLPRPTAVQSSYDDLALPGKVVSRAVFKASSSDQQVPSYATLPRTTRVETENRKQNYDNINEDPGFESYGNKTIVFCWGWTIKTEWEEVGAIFLLHLILQELF